MHKVDVPGKCYSDNTFLVVLSEGHLHDFLLENIRSIMANALTTIEFVYLIRV